MMTQPQTHAVVDPWRDKGGRFRLIAAPIFLACFAFAVYDSPGFYARYMKLCSEQPTKAECRPLNLAKEDRPPSLSVTLDYGKGNWALTVGPRQAEAEANALASRLRSSGIEPRVVKVSAKGKKTRYEVQVGRFTTSKGATEAGSQLKGKGLIQDFRAAEYHTVR